MFVSIGVRTLITIGSMSILARLLTPKDFGYVAMATVMAEFAVLLSGFGLSNILIQKRVITRLQIDTVFWSGVLTGTVLFLILFTFSFFSTVIFYDQQAGELLRLLSITFFLGGLTHVHEAIVSRLMMFRADFWIQLAVIFIRSGSAIVFAYLGYGAWSLVAGSVTGYIANVIIMSLVVPYIPRFKFHPGYVISNWRTSGSYLFNGIIHYVNTNVDIFLIGRAMGASSLGYYQNARSLSDEVRGRIAMPLQRVLFPALSAIQTDLPRLQASVVKSSRLLSLLIVPIGFGMSAVADELVPILYGSQWLAMIPILSFFGVSAALKGATAIAMPILNSQNRVSLSLKYNLIGTFILVSAVVVSIPFGIKIVSFSIALASFYGVYLLYISFRVIGLRFKHVVITLGIPLLCSGMMWSAIYFLRDQFREFAPSDFVMLFLLVLSGMTVYLVSVIAISPSYLREFLSVFEGVLRKGSGGK